MTTATRNARADADVDARPSAPIDPRIRARRVAIKRSAGRRRLRWVIAFLVLVALVLVAVAVVFSPLLDVDRITVAGQFRTDPGDIVAAGGVHRGEPLARVDLAAAAQRVEALPWVAQATVVRDWPGTLHYRVTERVPVAAVQGPDATWVAVDGEGRVLAALDAAPDDLPTVEGSTIAATVGATAPADERDVFTLAAAIPTESRPLVDAVVLDDRGGLTVRLASGGGGHRGPGRGPGGQGHRPGERARGGGPVHRHARSHRRIRAVVDPNAGLRLA